MRSALRGGREPLIFTCDWSGSVTQASVLFVPWPCPSPICFTFRLWHIRDRRRALIFQQVLDRPGRGPQTSQGLHSIPFLGHLGNPRLPPLAITQQKHLSTMQVGTVSATAGCFLSVVPHALRSPRSFTPPLLRLGLPDLSPGKKIVSP